jgi:hypothetical protein
MQQELFVQESFTLADIDQRSSIAVERLRYVIDSKILPGRRNGKVEGTITPGRGVARRFTGFESFGIVIAVLMLDAGMKRDAVKKCFEILCDYGKGTREINSVMLYQAYQRSEIVALELGDAQNIRLVYMATPQGTARTDGWIQVQTRAKVVEYSPLVTIRIDVVKLREYFKR